MKILVLEDDLILSEIIKEYLENLNYSISIVFDGNSAIDLLYTEPFDLLLFDINVPIKNGFDVLKKLNNDKIKKPIIFLTSSSDVKDLIKAYELGANDFIRKPFKLDELKERINYIRKTFFIETYGTINISPLIKFNTSDLSIITSGKKINLPKKEALILKYFLLNKNRIISIDELISNIWEFDNIPSIATIRTYVKNLRSILKTENLKTVKGIGYIFETTL